MIRPIFLFSFVVSMSVVVVSSASAFSISGPGGNQPLAYPGTFYKGETPKPKYDFKQDIAEDTDKIGNPIPKPAPDPHRFDINMTKPVTTQDDVNTQAEKSCVVLGLSAQKHNNENYVRAKCHMLNMHFENKLPILHPLLDHSKDGDDDGKNYKPHIEMGKLHFSVIHQTVNDASDNIFKRHKDSDISTEDLPTDSLKGADRSCDLTSDLRVMLSPRCLNNSETRARERIGIGNYRPIEKEDVRKAVEIRKKDNDNGVRYLCHIDFNPVVRHGFIQGYLKNKEDCITAGNMMPGAIKEEIFDQMGYIVGKHYNHR